MRKFFSIEFLRFLSSLSVLIYHYRLFFNPLNILSEDNYDLTKHEWENHPKNDIEKAWAKHAKENFSNWKGSSYYESFGPYY